LIGPVGSKEEMRVAFDGMNCLRSSEAFKNEPEGHIGLAEIWTMDWVLEMDEAEKDLVRTHSRT
jgi:hypothetical protein